MLIFVGVEILSFFLFINFTKLVVPLFYEMGFDVLMIVSYPVVGYKLVFTLK